MKYSDELKKSIDELFRKTQANEFSWVRENPTTFYFEQSYTDSRSPVKEKFLVSIQKVELTRSWDRNLATTALPSSLVSAPDRYIFQIKDIDLSRIDLKVDTLDENHGEEIHESLEQLYEAVISQISDRSLEVLHKVLGNT